MRSVATITSWPRPAPVRGMLKSHLPHLFDDDPNLRAKADALAERIYELISFLVDVRGFVLRTPIRGRLPTTTDARGCGS